MENIRQAIERAKVGPGDHASRGTLAERTRDWSGSARTRDSIEQIELSRENLEANRIVAHDPSDTRSKAFDMLRTQVLQSMDLKGWKTLAITSPTAACGKTLTSINLSFSIARQPERSAFLVDMDLRKPQVARCLGLRCSDGLLGVLEGQATVEAATVTVGVGNAQLKVLPAEIPTAESSEWMNSRAMSATLQEIGRSAPDSIVILDLPPLLYSDDVISILPHIDCVILVTAVGTTTIAELKECNKHLQTADVIRVVVNKVPEVGKASYY